MQREMKTNIDIAGCYEAVRIRRRGDLATICLDTGSSRLRSECHALRDSGRRCNPSTQL